MGGTIYLHRNYDKLLPNQDALKYAKKALKKHHPDFKYNVIKSEPDGRTTFFNSPDFDTAEEPTAGEFVVVDGKNIGRRKTNKIWHHKWTFVDDKYKGFNVDNSFARSEAWLQIPNINFSHIGDPIIWNSVYVPQIAQYAKKSR